MAHRSPPDEDQIYRVREFASQLEYAFRARPRPGTNGRASWERRFFSTFSRMVQIIAVAQFEYLPPFAIACIWENNRRSHADEPEFDIELIGDAYSPGHPVYHTGQGHLVYKPAFDGPFAAFPEESLRNVWWAQHPAPAPLPAGGIGGGPNHAGPDGGVDAEQQVQPGAAEDVQPHAEDDVEQPAGLANGEMEADAGDDEEDMEADVESKPGSRSNTTQSSGAGRGRSKSTGKQETSALEPRRTTRSASRPRTSTGTVTTSVPSSRGARGQPQSAKAKGKRKATEQEATSDTGNTATTPSTEAAGGGDASAKGKGKQTPCGQTGRRAQARGVLGLKDITPEIISMAEVHYPRPCERCVRRGLVCMYSPLLRSGCSPCDSKNAKCFLAFVNKKNHPLATYLGYARYRMISHPDVYAEPDFSPLQWPTSVPDQQDIGWVREQYDAQPRGRPARGRKQTIQATQDPSAALPDADAYAAQSATSPAASADKQQPEEPDEGTTIVMTRRSRSVSAAPSRASSTLPGSSTVSAAPPAATASAVSGTSASSASGPTAAADVEHSPSPSDRSQASTAAMSVHIQDTDHYDTFGPGGREHDDVEDVEDNTIMDIDAGPGPSALVPGASPVTSTPKAIESLRPDLKELKASRLPHEFARRSSARRNPPPLPPRPAGAIKYVKAPFAVKPIEDTWENLPRLGRRLDSGVYSVIGPPHDDNTPQLLKQLLQVGRQDLEVLDQLDMSNAGPLPPSPSHPITPEPQQFVFTDNVIRLAQDTKAKFDEITTLQGQIQAECALLKARSGAVMARHGPAISRFADAGIVVAEDVRDAYESLLCVHQILSRFAAAFASIPAVPWNWPALLELLTKVDELRDLYKVSWERFDTLEEDLRPVRGEMYRLHNNVALIEAQLDGIANDTVLACEPLLHNIFEHFSSRIENIEQRLRRLDGGAPSSVGPPEANIGQVLNIITTLSERVDRLERAVGEPLRSRIEGTIANYLAERGLTEDVLWKLGNDVGGPQTAVEAGGSVSEVLHTVYEPPSTGGNLPPPASSVQQFRTPLDAPARTPNAAGPSRIVPGGAAVSTGMSAPPGGRLAPAASASAPAPHRARPRVNKGNTSSSNVTQRPKGA
ncbi:hypothetical protein LXA43DRAFT_1102196 [Ganoderma leucocontextum]|nr:hypothetical protein LXA43DRAFT_1102196 [Ganoderma leucocontextum]